MQARGHSQREFGVAGREGIPPLDRRDGVPVTAQHLLQHFAPPRRVRSDQHAPGELIQEQVQRRERMLRAGIDPQLIHRGRREVEDVVAAQLFVDLERVQGHRRKLRQSRVDVLGADKQLGRRKHRTFDVVPPILIPRLDSIPGLGERASQVAVMHQHGIGGEIVKQGRCFIKEQRHIKLDTGRSHPLAHATIDGRAGGIPFKPGPEAAAEIPHAIRIQRNLARRQQADPIE